MEEGFPTMTPNPEATKKMLSFFKNLCIKKRLHVNTQMSNVKLE